MKCPRCQNELRRSQYNDDRVYQCSTCAGYLVERKDLALIDLSATAATDDDDSAHEHFVPSQVLRTISSEKQHGKIRCPRCHSDMKIRTVSASSDKNVAIELDECNLCHAFWFDAGELVAVQETENAVRESVSELRQSLQLANTPNDEPIESDEQVDLSSADRNERELVDIVLMVGMIGAALLTLLFKLFRFEVFELSLLAGLAFLVVTILAVTTTWRFLSFSSNQTIIASLVGIVGSILAVLICVW